MTTSKRPVLNELLNDPRTELVVEAWGSKLSYRQYMGIGVYSEHVSEEEYDLMCRLLEFEYNETTKVSL